LVSPATNHGVVFVFLPEMSIGSKLREIMAALTPNCRDAARVQSDQLEGPLPVARRVGLFLHLLICKWCRRYGRQIRFLRKASHECPEKLSEADSRTLSNSARERIKSRLEEERKQP
jgi:hypothetical protein